MITSQFLKDKSKERVHPCIYAGLTREFKLVGDIEIKVARAVEEEMEVKAEQFLDTVSKVRKPEIVESRRLFFYMLTKKLGAQVSATANKFNYNHATILHHNKKVIEFSETYPEYKEMVDRVYQRIIN